MGGASARRVMKMMQGPEGGMAGSLLHLLNCRSTQNSIIRGLSNLKEKDEPTAILGESIAG